MRRFVWLFIGGITLGFPSAACWAKAASPEDGSPDLIHMGWEDDPATTMTIVWRTKGNQGRYRVHYGSEQGSAQKISHEARTTPAPGGSQRFGYLHRVSLKGLEPDSAYYFSVTGDQKNLQKSGSFRTAPREMPEKGFSFAAYGDQGIYPGSFPVAKALAQDKDVRFVTIVGDISYSNGIPEGPAPWFDAVAKPWAGEKPLMVVWGNHEYVKAKNSEAVSEPILTQVPFFVFPKAPHSLPRYHSWTYAGIHFVALDDPAPYNPYFLSQGGWEAERRWVSEDLAKASQDPQIQWIIVLAHRPPFSGAQHYFHRGGEWDQRCCRGRELDWGWDRYGVDLFIAGHDHHYSATHPVSCYYREISDPCGDSSSQQIQKQKGKGRIYKNPKAAVYVTAGIGGAPLYEQSTTHPWQAARDAKHYGYLKITATPQSLHVAAINAESAGDLLDEFTIRKTTSTR